MADIKIKVSINLSPRQLSAIRDEARRLGIAESEAHRRLLDEGIDSTEARLLPARRFETAARQVG